MFPAGGIVLPVPHVVDIEHAGDEESRPGGRQQDQRDFGKHRSHQEIRAAGAEQAEEEENENIAQAPVAVGPGS